MRRYKRVKCLKKIGIDSKTLETMKTSTWKAIIKEESVEIMNRDIQQKKHEEIDIPEGSTCK